MKATDHPDYEVEVARLAAVLRAVQDWLSQLPIDDAKIEDYATAILLNWSSQWRSSLAGMDESPYFGRIDIKSDAREVEQLYIGRRGLRDRDAGSQLVVDWRAPVAASFYRPGPDVDLRRRYKILQGELIDIADDVIGEHGGFAVADAVLAQVLAQSRGRGLKAVVETIQAEQDELVRSDDHLLIVQGAAGTGKTVVALHRLAYRLYQGRAADPRRQRGAVVFGPNRLFLQYTASVLPTLGETDVVQTTFSDWAAPWIGVLATKVPLVPPDGATIALRSGARFGRVLERHVHRLREESERLVSASRISVDLRVGGRGQLTNIRPTPGDVSTALDLARNRPYNRAREAVRSRLWLVLKAKIDRAFADSLEVEDARGPASASHRAKKAFEVQFDRLWGEVSASLLYRSLLWGVETFEIASAGEFGPEEVRTILDGEISALDIPGISYAGYLVDGPVRSANPRNPVMDSPVRYGHAVVDEAQDWSPLQFAVVAAHADSMTVLGDLAQALDQFHRIVDWSEVREAIPAWAARDVILGQSYRSTRQIMEFANLVRQTLGSGTDVAKPFPRDGERVQAWSVRDDEELVSEIAVELRWLAGAQFQTLAVLCRTGERARYIGEQLAQQLPSGEVQILGELDEKRLAAVNVMPVTLSKGMDFDAVFVVDADDETYPPDELSGRHLYVAVTRALHRLFVVWKERPSPHLRLALDSLDPDQDPEGSSSQVKGKGAES